MELGITFALVALAAICNAVMDTMVHHWKKSIFAELDPRSKLYYFFHEKSWRNKYINLQPANGRKKWFGVINIHPAFLDGWHLCKSLMIIFLMTAVAISAFSLTLWWHWPAALILLGTAWNVTFSIFYNKILMS